MHQLKVGTLYAGMFSVVILCAGMFSAVILCAGMFGVCQAWNSTFSTACDLPNCRLISHVASSTLKKRIKSFRHSKTQNIDTDYICTNTISLS